MNLNLAHKPFVNERPVRRVGFVLMFLGLVLAVVNAYLYWNHLSDKGSVETGLLDVIGQVDQERALLAAAEAELEDFEPAELNLKIEFVNLRILQRTFSWSRLFDLVAEALPGDVRLTSLTPRFGKADGRRRGRARDTRSDEVSLEIRGEARSSEALLELVDRLFAHPAFADPDLHQEAKRAETAVIVFSISTLYLPDSAADNETKPAEEAE